MAWTAAVSGFAVYLVAAVVLRRRPWPLTLGATVLGVAALVDGQPGGRLSLVAASSSVP